MYVFIMHDFSIILTVLGYYSNEDEFTQSKLKAIEGPSDTFATIYQSGPAGLLSWQNQVKAAIQKESDEFRRQVCKVPQTTSYLHKHHFYTCR